MLFFFFFVATATSSSRGASALETVNASVAFKTIEPFFDEHLMKREAVLMSDVWSSRARQAMDMSRLLACGRNGNTVEERCHASVLKNLWVPRFVANDYAVRSSTGKESPRLLAGDQDEAGCGPSHALYLGLSEDKELTVEGKAFGKVSIASDDFALFVPGGQAAKAHGFGLLFCFVDASNVFDVMSMPSDTHMDLYPQDLSWSDYITWPRNVSASTSSTSRNDFNRWQKEQRWRWKILAATLPALSNPRVVESSYESATVAFDHDFKPPDQDDSTFGIQVEFSSEDGPLNASSKGSGLSNGLVMVESEGGTISGLLPGRSYRMRGRIAYADAVGRQWSPFFQVDTLLRRPPSKVNVSSLVPGDAPGRVRIVAELPADDGGDSISGWIVRARHLSFKAFTEDWVGLGSFSPSRQIDIDHLLPSKCGGEASHEYHVQIAAYNRLGAAEWSDEGDKVSPGCVETNDKHTLKGRGAKRSIPAHHLNDDEADDDWQTSVDLVRADLLSAHPHLGHNNLPIADVTEDLLRVWLPGDFGKASVVPRISCDLWTSHFSPRHFDVAAEIVLADPQDASSPLLGDYRHRVVLVRRGTVSFPAKAIAAQKAGALAVVVFDDGQCDGLDQYCVPGAERSRGERFAALDSPEAWREVHIPVGLVLYRDAEKVISLLAQHRDEL